VKLAVVIRGAAFSMQKNCAESDEFFGVGAEISG
jgi:hypothetical protein